MAKVRRNGPCPCGSGSKAKSCCFGTQENREHRLPSQLLEEVYLDLKGIDKVDLRRLLDRLPSLPKIDPGLHAHLGVLTRDMDCAIDALQDDDDGEFDLALHKVVPEIDSIHRRIDLAQAVITLRDRGRISPKLAAVAVIDLDGQESNLLLSSVAESLAVRAGDVTYW